MDNQEQNPQKNAAANMRIKITENGPYVVTGGVPLVRRTPAMSTFGEPLEWDPVGAEVEPAPASRRYELCRCGHSANKPFCDSTHESLPGLGALIADRELSQSRRQVFQGAGVLMTDDTSLCSETGFCGTRFTKVWQMIRRTADPEVRARLLRMVSNCPSGRLEATLKEGQPLEPQYLPSIAAVTDGPLWIRGGIPVEAPDGFTYEVRNRVTLCRCGESKNKPFCDGTHERIDFKAP